MQPLAVAWRTAAPRSERKIKDVMLWRCWGKRKGSQQNLFTKFLWVEVAVKNMEKITRSFRDIWHSPPGSRENASVSEQLVCDTNLTLSTTHAAWYSCRANDAHKLVGDRVIQVPDLRKRLEMRFWGNPPRKAKKKNMKTVSHSLQDPQQNMYVSALRGTLPVCYKSCCTAGSLSKKKKSCLQMFCLSTCRNNFSKQKATTKRPRAKKTLRNVPNFRKMIKFSKGAREFLGVLCWKVTQKGEKSLTPKLLLSGAAVHTLSWKNLMTLQPQHPISWIPAGNHSCSWLVNRDAY